MRPQATSTAGDRGPDGQHVTVDHGDLIGLEVRDAEGTPFGSVVAVLNFGASDILEIRRADGTELLVTFTDEAVPEVNLDQGWLRVIPPVEME